MVDKEKIDEILLGFSLRGEIVEKKEGTLGIVYIVRQQGMPEYVAYKTIKDEALKGIEKDKIRKFVHEMRQWFKVKGHPLILSPHYITLYKRRPLICMPFCELDLRTYLEKRQKLDITESLILIAQLLKALTYAKKVGIESHQDLKPENILLKDLREKFADFPPRNMPWFRYKIQLADFGNANAWREIGRPYGSRPYMAPEQFTQGTDFSKVDVFAAGVILYELVTGIHPIGERTSNIWPDPKKGYPRKYKHEKPWRKWACNKDKIVKIGNSEFEKKLESLVKKMLEPDPAERISLEDALTEIMELLASINKAAYKQLKLLFAYYDRLAEYFKECRGRLRSLIELSKVPGQLEVVISEILQEIDEMKGKIDHPKKAVYFCELCYYASTLLLKRRKPEDAKLAEKVAKEIINEASRWKGRIRAEHKYPPLKFMGQEWIKTPSFTDFEVFSELINYGRKILEVLKGKQYTKKYFSKLQDNTLKAAYFYGVASDFHMEGKEKDAIKILDKCIRLNPNEATFHYVKALYAYHYFLKAEASRELTSTERQKLVRVIRRSATKARDLAPNWKEPKELLENLEEL